MTGCPFVFSSLILTSNRAILVRFGSISLASGFGRVMVREWTRRSCYYYSYQQFDVFFFLQFNFIYGIYTHFTYSTSFYTYKYTYAILKKKKKTKITSKKLITKKKHK